MNIFENKDSMPGSPDLTVKTAMVSGEDRAAKLPGERKEPELSVRNIQPRMRGCHY